MTTVTRIVVLLMFFGAAMTFSALASAANCAKNPNHPHCGGGEPPPPPPPTGTDCLNEDGAFPAVAYKTETETGKRRKRRTITDVYVANSTGTCAVKVFTTEVSISSIDYKQRSDGLGRIVWSQDASVGSAYPTIRMMEFEFSNKTIISGVPLSQSTVYSVPVSSSVGIGAPALSDDASQVIFSVEESDGQGGWLDHINIADVSNCISNCPTTRILEMSNQGIFPLGDGLAMNTGGDRIYFASHDRTADVHKLSFIEDQGGMWSSPTDVVTDDDSGNAGRSFRELDAGTSATGDEVVAVHYEQNGSQTAVKVLSAENCTVDPARSASCYSTGLSTEVAHIPYVAVPTFTNTTFGVTPAPGLAIQHFDGTNWVFHIADLSTFGLELVPDMPDQRLAIGD